MTEVIDDGDILVSRLEQAAGLRGGEGPAGELALLAPQARRRGCSHISGRESGGDAGPERASDHPWHDERQKLEHRARRSLDDWG